MLLHSERACGSSARRRRERRLRSWAKHERMSIAIVVAENLHHSRQKVEGNTSRGLRAQKSAVAPGCHPGILKDPEVQWLKERSLFVSAGCPSLAVSPLTEHERLLAQSLAPRAQELSNVESMVSTSSHLVPESIEQLELGTPEVRSQWYRAQSSFAPDLGWFPVSLPGVAGSPSVLVENSLSVSQLLGQPVMSSLFPVPQLGKKPHTIGLQVVPTDCGQSCSKGSEKETRGDS